MNNEFYVCPVYNEFLLKNKKVKIHNVDKMFGLGTPEDLNNLFDLLNEFKKILKDKLGKIIINSDFHIF